MSTLALQPGEAVASTGEPTLLSRLMRGLIKSREEQAKRRIRVYFAGCDDDRLRGFGFSTEDIRVLRQGGFRQPNH